MSLQKFQSECQLLSLVRHPNIVQYLSTSFDEESGQPVLLMELCDESLTKFLERSPGPLPYHTELSISHDIALALIYLHSNELLHRDLSSNNVLMDGGRAKVTDFGMSKFQSARLQTDTVCPGSVHYMSPEALDEPPSYTKKLDIFSFGVLLVQIMTRKFPDPGPRFRVVHDPRYSTPVRVPIREVERRQAHLQLIDDTHPLKLLALQCLNDDEKHRPTAQELGQRIEHLKATRSLPTSFRNSPRLKIKTWTQSEEEDEEPVVHEQMLHQERLEEQLQQVKMQLVGQRVISDAAHKNLEKANSELEEERKKLKEVLEKEKMREKHIFEQHQRREKEVMEREQKWKKDTAEKEKQMEKLKQELEDSQEFVKAFQRSLGEQEQRVKGLKQEVSDLRQSLQQKEQAISSLQATVVSKERRIEELEHQVKNGAVPPAAAAPQKDITQLRWEELDRTPEPMSAGSAVAIGDSVFVSPASSTVVYRYNRAQKWSLLPPCPYKDFSLAVVNNTLTTVGGFGDEYTNKLLSFTEQQRWTKTLPPMPTARKQPVTLSTEQHLIVAGGFNGLKSLDTVEALATANNEWNTVCKLLFPLYGGSATLCANQIYIVPEVVDSIGKQDLVLSCSFDDLFKPPKKSRFSKTSGPWQKLKSLPVALSTIATLDGHILALGGKDMQAKNNTHTSATVWELVQGSWKNVSCMKTGRWSSIAAVSPKGQLVVVGGKSNWENMDSVEIATL